MCLLVMIGVRADDTKKLIALGDGHRESTESWVDLVRGCERRGMAAPVLELGIKPKRTRPYRPQTNGKIERFHRTLAGGWALARTFLSESARRKTLPAWLHEYNHRRPPPRSGTDPRSHA